LATISTAQQQTRPASRQQILPGLGLSFGLAVGAQLLGTWVPLIGGPVFGILVGLLVRSFFAPDARFKPGIAFSSKKVLQGAIILLGFGLSLSQIVTTGSQSLAVMLSTIVVCLLVARLAGPALGISGDLTTLLGVGTAICGASAIAAVSPVIEAEERDVAYSISTVFAFNIAAVLLFPAFGHLMGMSQHSFGLLAGTAVNDTSSVVAAAYSFGAEAGTFATVVKLTRSTLIIPIALGIAAIRAVRAKRAGGEGSRVKVSKLIPWFVVWFLAAAVVNSTGLLPKPLVADVTTLAKFLIVVALTAVGLSADFRQMARTGLKPILLGLILWLAVTATSLAVQYLTGQLV
jgi:uncharacterized integral membrane protein (TIGR00698 family)